MNKKLIWLAGILAIVSVGLSTWSWLDRRSSTNLEGQVEEIINQELSGDVADKPADVVIGDQLLGSWQIVSLTDGQQEMFDFSGNDVQIEFNEGVLGGRICNSFGGNYKVVDEANLVADGPIAHTEMACDDQLMKLEDVFIRGMERGWGYGISDNNILALVSSDGWIIGLMRK
jgi:hypothetical protein